MYVGTGAGWPMGETPPITWPVCSRTNSGLARASRPAPIVAAVSRGVDPVRPGGQDQDRCAMVVEDEAVGDRADLAAEGLGGEGGRVDGLGQDDDLTRCRPGGRARREIG